MHHRGGAIIGARNGSKGMVVGIAGTGIRHPRAAPLPTYQCTYSDNRYPRAPEQQRAIPSQNYSYQPREPVVLQTKRPERRQPDQRTQGQKNENHGHDQGDHRDKRMRDDR